MKIICLAHAGGDSKYFNKFKIYVSKYGIDIVPIEYNGRGKFKAEKKSKNFDELCEEVIKKIMKLTIDDKYVIFGHSMGGLLAYEICTIMKQKNLKMPEHLYISSRDEPMSKHSCLLTGNALKTYLIQLDLHNKCIYDNKRIAKIYLERTEHDFKVLYSHKYTNNKPPLDIEASVFWGEEDSSLLLPIDNWNKYFKSKIRYYKFDGGHFYLNKHYCTVIDIIIEDMRINSQ